MSKALVDNFTKEELEEIIKSCSCLREVLDKLGYSTVSGSNHKTVQSRIDKYNIDTSHFSSKTAIERSRENVFIENSTASQATLRRWYLKENLPYVCTVCGLEPYWQGKPLTLILDHINGKNNDDRLENLRWVCPNCNQQLETTGHTKFHSLKKENQSKQNHCVDCKKQIDKRATRCKECELKRRSALIPISREELKDLIREKPFTEIGRIFAISDNAIRKWCDKFNLPRNKSVINSYSDSEWENI